MGANTSGRPTVEKHQINETRQATWWWEKPERQLGCFYREPARNSFVKQTMERAKEKKQKSRPLKNSDSQTG